MEGNTDAPTGRSSPTKAEDLPTTNIFEQQIWQHPGICNGCYSLCKDFVTHEGRPINAVGGSADNYPERTSWRTADGELGYDAENLDEYGVRQAHPPRTLCRNCGSVRLLADDDPLSKREAHGRIERIADRLEEQGYAVDRRMMRKWVEVHKSTEVFASYDRKIFASAVQHFVDVPDS